ncbi:MAG TPA: CapA family protein [Candidatus Udaeobacter sp.]|jgi:poly-gamma-glutamate synthesis protein (capsule biosynthesis protein)|nr:CapA family protein [Candidatus Udaeobacter sp.]
MRLFLCGDVMTGRGIDQVLSHPVNPILYEPYMRDAREYVALAEKANGPLPRPLSVDYIWGDALRELERAEVDLRIANLETAITSAQTPWPEKAIHYRMHPRNIGCLTSAKISACALANNHVLDWGYDGLSETLKTLDAAGIAHAGAGNDAEEAMQPAVLETAGDGRLLLFSFGSRTSGIPEDWKPTSISPGVNLLDDFSEATAARTADQIRAYQRPGDLIIVSIHWGSNWGYEIPRDQILFAHCLIEEGIAIVHGHSSHHVKSVEVFKGRVILYGCGDFLTDYEGIGGYEMFRGDLALMYLIEINSHNGELISARLVPMCMRRFRLERASGTDAEWLFNRLNELGSKFSTGAGLEKDRSLTLEWSSR